VGEGLLWPGMVEEPGGWTGVARGRVGGRGEMRREGWAATGDVRYSTSDKGELSGVLPNRTPKAPASQPDGAENLDSPPAPVEQFGAFMSCPLLDRIGRDIDQRGLRDVTGASAPKRICAVERRSTTSMMPRQAGHRCSTYCGGSVSGAELARHGNIQPQYGNSDWQIHPQCGMWTSPPGRTWNGK